MTTPSIDDAASLLQSLRDAGACTASAKTPDACPEHYTCALSDGTALCLTPASAQTTGSVQTSAETTDIKVRGITEWEVISVFAVFIAGIAIGRYWPSRRR